MPEIYPIALIMLITGIKYIRPDMKIKQYSRLHLNFMFRTIGLAAGSFLGKSRLGRQGYMIHHYKEMIKYETVLYGIW